MPNEDKTFSGSLVLDLRIWWRHAYTLYEIFHLYEVYCKIIFFISFCLFIQFLFLLAKSEISGHVKVCKVWFWHLQQ